MIKIPPYSIKFCDYYVKSVREVLRTYSHKDDDLEKRIIESTKTYLGKDYYKTSDPLRELILSSHNELEIMLELINNNFDIWENEVYTKNDEGKKIFRNDYKNFHDAYTKLINKRKDLLKLNVRLVKESGIVTCSYCNRDYINARHLEASGAQLDHFIPRASYPIFSLSIYNLVPSCGNCNRVKSDKSETNTGNDEKINFISPHDQSFDFEGNLRFTYRLTSVDNIEIEIKASNDLENNIEAMSIKNAYQIHDIDIKEMIEKRRKYNITQMEEIQAVLHKYNIGKNEMKDAIFGKEPKESEYGKKTLSKFRRDILREMKIYE